MINELNNSPLTSTEEFIDNILTDAIAETMATIEPRDEEVRKRYETLLKNTAKNILLPNFKVESNLHKPSLDLMLPMVKHCIDGLTEICDIVGCQPMDAPVADIYKLRHKTTEDVDNNRRMSIEVLTEEANAYSKKLGAAYTLEACQDSYHNENFKHYFHQTLGLEIAEELTGHIIQDIVAIGSKHSDLEPFVLTKENIGHIAVRLNMASIEIARITRRGCGNKIIMHSDLWDLICADLPYSCFKTDELYDEESNHSLKKVGILNGTMELYITKLIPKDTISVSYRGVNTVDSGYIFAPYMIALDTGVVVNPVTYQPLVGFFNRSSFYCDELGFGYYNTIKVDTTALQKPE